MPSHIKTTITVFAIAFTFACMSQTCTAQQLVKADDPRIAYTGRCSHSTPGAVAWNWPGLQIDAAFTGTSISMKTSPGSGYYMVVIDNEPAFKVESTKENSVVELAKDLAPTSHRINITYCIEGL